MISKALLLILCISENTEAFFIRPIIPQSSIREQIQHHSALVHRALPFMRTMFVPTIVERNSGIHKFIQVKAVEAPPVMPQPSYAKSDDQYGYQEPSYGSPKKSYKSSYPEPEPVYGAPEPVYKAPEPVYKAPEPVYKAPEPTHSGPQMNHVGAEQPPSSPENVQEMQPLSGPTEDIVQKPAVDFSGGDLPSMNTGSNAGIVSETTSFSSSSSSASSSSSSSETVSTAEQSVSPDSQSSSSSFVQTSEESNSTASESQSQQQETQSVSFDSVLPEVAAVQDVSKIKASEEFYDGQSQPVHTTFSQNPAGGPMEISEQITFSEHSQSESSSQVHESSQSSSETMSSVQPHGSISVAQSVIVSQDLNSNDNPNVQRTEAVVIRPASRASAHDLEVLKQPAVSNVLS